MKREDKALVEFKHIMDDVVHLLLKSTNSKTVYFYWVNRSREQFVLETNATHQPNVMFRDRVPFDKHFLHPYTELQSFEQLKVGQEVEEAQLQHYNDEVPIRHLTLIPFINNGETVAITVVETENELPLSDFEQTFSAYRNALVNVLNTYLELTGFYDEQQIWIDYDESLNKISPKQHKVQILDTMVEEMQKLLPTGGVSVLLRGMEVWTIVLNSEKASHNPSPGLMMEEKSMSYDALQQGTPQFSIHFNQNPKRVATDEKYTDGATLAIPILISGRRHGVVLAYDKNPLTFKESTKHQLINLVRTAVLSIKVNLGKLPVYKDLFTSEYGSFIPDLWEKAISKEISRQRVNNSSQVWLGLITIDNLQSIRSKYRLEELNRIQRTVVKMLNPSRFGFNGYIGFKSDYVFTYLLFCDTEAQHQEWLKAVKAVFDEPVELSDGQQVEIEIKSGHTCIQAGDQDVHQVVTKVKKELSGVLNATG